VMRPVGKHLKKTRNCKSKQVEFPHAGPPGARLYRVGACLGCHILLMSYTPKALDRCGFCEAARCVA
jgi:hypothetical protein